MINLSSKVKIIKEGEDLSLAVIEAIQLAKKCVVDHFLGETSVWPSPDQITAGGKNPFNRITIIKFFHLHNDPTVSPEYNAEWIDNLYLAAIKAPTPDQIIQLIPRNSSINLTDINKHFRDHFKYDALLIIHFLWFRKAILLPFTLARPVARNNETGGNDLEYAANYYPETLALVRYPFISNINKNLTKLTDFMPSTAQPNFNRLAWRFIRATDWHTIEDISVDDVATYFSEFTDTHRRSENIPNYSFAPKALLAYFEEAFPERCQFSIEDSRLINTRIQATGYAINSGTFHVSKGLEKQKEKWLFYEHKFLQRIKLRGIKKWERKGKTLGILNAYLLEELPSKVGEENVPMPGEFTRKFIDDFDHFPSLIDHVKAGRKPGTVSNILITINQFMDYLESSATTYDDLKNFRNPINPSLDFPILNTANSTSKAIFQTEHFAPLIQFCYAIEAFGWFLSEKIYDLKTNAETTVRKQNTIKDSFNSIKKVYDTESLGFVPVVFVKNSEFCENKPRSTNNRKLVAVPIFFISKSILPSASRRFKNCKGLTSLPILNYVQQTIVALETGIRNIHIRWLDSRTYDKKVDRSKPLPPICTLWVPTDKAHGEWGAKVSKSVIEVLDRQRESHDWFDEPVIHEETWYDDHEDSEFGKIATIFPAGLSRGRHKLKPGPLTEDACTVRFKNIVFAFDLFCRYSLGVDPSNQLPQEFLNIESLNTLEDYSNAWKLFDQYKASMLHTPHSCRASVVSHWITILPPNIIGDYITGHSTIEHVLYYVKIDPDYLKRHQQYQKLAFENGFSWDESKISTIKAEDINSALRRAFDQDKDSAIFDFGAISYERVSPGGQVLSGLTSLKKRTLDEVTYHGTHICPFGDHCPKDIVNDLNAIPGIRKPCGACYYSVKTVDHLPRIGGHIRSMVEESAELKNYIDDAKAEGASIQSLEEAAERRKYLGDEISAWTVAMHCLEEMLKDVKNRAHFLVQEPEIVRDHLQAVLVESNTLENLMARLAEARTHAEFFTPQLKSQLKVARAKILRRSGDLHRLLQDEPDGFALIDEFRGIIKSTCTTLGISIGELAKEIEKPMLTNPDTASNALKLIFSSGGGENA